MGPQLDAKRICERFVASRLSGLHFAYRSVAEDFRMIETTMAPVIVPYDDIAQAAVDKLRVEAIPSGALARNLQTYIVQVPLQARRMLIESGSVGFASPECRGEQFAVLRRYDLYTEDVGLLWDLSREIEDYIF